MNKWAVIAISSLTDFLITTGTAYTTIAQGGETAPSRTQVVICIVGGIIAAARSVQKMMSEPPR